MNYDDFYFDTRDQKLIDDVKDGLVKLGVTGANREVHYSGLKKMLIDEPVYVHWKGSGFWVKKIYEGLITNKESEG